MSSWRSRLLSGLPLLPLVVLSAPAFAGTFPLTLLNSDTTTSFGAGLSPAISAGQVEFNGPSGTVYTENADGTGLTQVLNNQTPVPGGMPAGQSATFDQYYGSQELIGGGQVVLIGTDSNSAGNTSGYGLYSVSAAGGTVTLLANETTTVNGHYIGDSQYNGTPNFFPIGSMAVNAAGQIAFEVGQQVYTVNAAGGAVTCVATYYCGDSPGGESIFQAPSISGNTVALAAGNIFGTAIVATTPLPSTPGGFSTAAAGNAYDPYSLNDKPVQDGGTTVFAAQNGNDTVGAIYANSGSGQTIALVTTNTPIPGGTGDFVWTNGIGNQSIAADNGMVVFFGAGASGANAGLYEVSESGGPITKIVAVGDQIGQGTVSGVSMGPQSLSDGTLVFNLSFSCTFSNCPEGYGPSIYTAQLVPTQTVSGPGGGSVASPTLLPVGNEQIGQVQTSIGNVESSIYEYSWSGGWFTSDGEIASAASGDSFNFDLFAPSGTLLDQVVLDAADSFQGTIGLNLSAGNYDIGFVCPGGGNLCPDPSAMINFDTPVDGVTSASVPEPTSFSLVAGGILILGMARIWRKRRPRAERGRNCAGLHRAG